MDNYIATVLLDGDTKPTEIINFGNSPEEIIDNIVQMKSVKFLYHIKRAKDGEFWDFDEELEPLRKIRKIILQDGNSEIALKLLIKDVIEDAPPKNIN